MDCMIAQKKNTPHLKKFTNLFSKQHHFIRNFPNTEVKISATQPALKIWSTVETQIKQGQELPFSDQTTDRATVQIFT